jgi:norsolorinic acid ketoreductase
LKHLPRSKDRRLITVQIDSASEQDASVTVEFLKKTHQIVKLDIVIANAGISNYSGTASVTPVAEMYEHFKINTVAPLLLF